MKINTSSNINSVEYDEFDRLLTVEFKGETKYNYYDVPVECVHEIDRLNNSEDGSVGKYINSSIKGVYKFSKVLTPTALEKELTKLLKSYKKYADTDKCFDLYTRIMKEHSLVAKQNDIKESIQKIQYKIQSVKKQGNETRQKNMEKALGYLKQKLYKNLYLIDMKGLMKILDLSKSEIYKRFGNLKRKLRKELRSFVTKEKPL